MADRKHILFISSWYPNRLNPSHGIFNRHFAEAAALHHKVSVLHVCSDPEVSSGSDFTETSEENIYTLHVYYKKTVAGIPGLSALIKLYRYLGAYKTGYRMLIKKRGQPDLIHLNVILPAGAGALFLHQKYKIPFVINEGWTGYAPEDGRYRGMLKKTLTGIIAAKAALILPVTDYLRELLIFHRLKGPFAIVPNVVNTSLFQPAADTTENNKVRFVHVSTLDDEQKNVSGILRSFARVVNKEKEVELIIIGDGPDRRPLERAAQQLQIEKYVTFKGRLTQAAIVKEIQTSDAMVLFSNYETFCLAAAEAMACGKPVITSNAGGIRSYMQENLGIMVEKKDEDGLTRAMLDLINNKKPFDPNVLREFAVDNFSQEVIAAKLNKVYSQVLEKSARH